MESSRTAYLYAGVTVLMWSTVASAFKVALRYTDIFQLLLIATLTSVLCLGFLYFVVQRQPIPSARDLRPSLVAGLLNPLVYYLILFEAYARLPAQIAQPVNYTWAITLTLLSIAFLGQKMTRRDLTACVICYGGVFVITTRNGAGGMETVDPVGIFLALLSTFVWAGYWILNMKDEREPLAALLLNFTCALPFTVIAVVIWSDFDVPLQGWLAGCYVGLFEMSLAFYCWSRALRLATNSSRVSNLIFLSPFLSLWFIRLIVGETIHDSTWLGLLMIVGGLVLQQWGNTPRETNTVVENQEGPRN